VLNRIRSHRWARGLATLTVFLLALLTAAGLLHDSEAFVGNVVAELVGIAIGVVVALFLVDRVAASRKSERWLRVREQTLDAIFAHITDLTRKCLLYTPIGDQFEDGWVELWFSLQEERPASRMTGVLRSIATVVAERAEDMSGSEGSGAATSRLALDAVAPHVAQIRDVLVPRLIDFDEVPALVERLLVMTDAEREWSLQVAFSEKGDLQEIWVAWDRAGQFFAASAEVVVYLEAAISWRSHEPR
jgi:hypothetical protein